MKTNARANRGALADEQSLRLRAAWMYYSHGMTQQAIAKKLGLGRSTVVRLLEKARERREVRFWIDEGVAACHELAVSLELQLGLSEVIVVPGASGHTQIARSVGLALGRVLSNVITDNMTLGVGWGRTLSASLESFRPPQKSGVRVMSLLGGTFKTQSSNPSEFSWRMASAMGAECFLFPAPLIVDSPKTKKTLIDKCGLHRLYDLARRLDVAVVSVGELSLRSTSLSKDMLTKQELDELVALGCVSDVMCNFLDARGNSVRHSINDRVMSIDLDVLSAAGSVIVASGGAHRALAILAAISRVNCTTLVTDEGAARAMLTLLVSDVG